MTDKPKACEACEYAPRCDYRGEEEHCPIVRRAKRNEEEKMTLFVALALHHDQVRRDNLPPEEEENV